MAARDATNVQHRLHLVLRPPPGPSDATTRAGEDAVHRGYVRLDVIRLPQPPDAQCESCHGRRFEPACIPSWQWP